MTNRVYWVSTGLLSALMVLSGILDLVHVQPFVETMRRLGYPEYLLTILGVARLVGASVLLHPGVPRAKEWAYAGFTFNFGGAAISLALSGATVTETLPSIFCGSLLAISYLTYRRRTREDASSVPARHHRQSGTNSPECGVHGNPRARPPQATTGTAGTTPGMHRALPVEGRIDTAQGKA